MHDEQLLKLALDYHIITASQGKRLAEMVVEREDMLAILRQDGTEAQEQAKLEERRRIAGMVRELIYNFVSTGIPYTIGIPYIVIRRCEDLATTIERDLPPAPTLTSDLLKRIADLERQVYVLKTMMDRIARGIVPAPDVSVSHYAWQALREVEEKS